MQRKTEAVGGWGLEEGGGRGGMENSWNMLMINHNNPQNQRLMINFIIATIWYDANLLLLRTHTFDFKADFNWVCFLWLKMEMH